MQRFVQIINTIIYYAMLKLLYYLFIQVFDHDGQILQSIGGAGISKGLFKLIQNIIYLSFIIYYSYSIYCNRKNNMRTC